MCLNHKAWEFADSNFLSRQNRLAWVRTQEQVDELTKVYTELYEQGYAEVEKMFAKDENALSYFISTLD